MLRAPAVEQRPFGLALSTLVEEARGQGLVTSLTIDGTPRALAPTVEFTLYRVAQEALTNVTRHSRAAHASCTLRYRDGDVVLQIEDDGVGAAGTDGGFGLTGVRERVQLVGGTMDVRTAAGQGFTIHVCVPA
jgi:signal transduction histidine kinase